MPNRGRAILYTLVVFLAGGLTGAVLTNLYEHFMRHPAGHVITPASWLKADRAHYIEKLRADLELTDTQTRDFIIQQLAAFAKFIAAHGGKR